MNIVVWGAGVWGKRCMSFLPNYGINIVAFIDSDEKKQGSCYLGLPIISLETYKKNYGDLVILIAISEFRISKDIQCFLEQNGIVCFSLVDCPSELCFTHGDERVPFNEYIDEIAGKFIGDCNNKVLAVKGWNFFSLLLYNYLENTGSKVYWIVSGSERKRCGKFLKNYYFISDDYANNGINIEYVFCTDISSDKSNSQENTIPFFKFDIERYRNNDLKNFHNMYNGRRCFVVANGPSLRMDDLQCLHENGELCFGVNGIYHAFARTDWRPNFYVATDPKMFESFSNDILNLTVPYKFLSDSSAEFWKQSMPSNVYKFHVRVIFDRSVEVPFSEDISVCTYDAGTVMHSVLQFAVYMGFTEIYILGADCQLIPGKLEHFSAEYCNIKDIKYRLATDMIFTGYEVAKKYADVHGIKIYNATRGGALEVFERAEFDSLFN